MQMDALFARLRQSTSEIPESNQVFLIVGLGNPGREYKDTRHNIGFLTIDAMACVLGVKLTKVQNKAIIGIGKINGSRVVLAKPQTYMNLSGQAVVGLMNFYKVPKENLIVIHDDIDLPFGTIRIRPKGGSAGQRGLGSTIDKLGSQDFARMRLGVGRPPGQMDPKDYVLQRFSKDEAEFLRVFLEKGCEAVKEFVQNGLEAAMNKYNGNI
jgi:peptidyl-tRNA hydrolase, PTH1 family